MPWWKRKSPPVEVETPFGRFVRSAISGDWDRIGEGMLDVSVGDREGSPDQTFLARIPGLLADLPSLERRAREAYDFETAAEEAECGPGSFVLQGLTQGMGDEDFVLAFGAEGEESDLGTVFVAFANGRVVDATLVH